MAVSLIGTPTNGTLTNASNSFSVTMPAGVQEGDLIVVHHRYNRASTTGYSHNLPVAKTAGAVTVGTFTQRYNDRVNSQSAMDVIFEQWAVGTESTIVVSRSDSDASRNDATVYILRDVNTNDPTGAALDTPLVIAEATFSSNTTTPALTWSTEAPDGSYAVLAFSANGTSSISGVTGGFTTYSSASTLGISAGKVIATAETPTSTVTATSRVYECVGIVYIPSGGTTGAVKPGMTASGWTNVGGNPTITGAVTDSSDTTYLESADNPIGQVVSIPLAALTAPATPVNLRATVRLAVSGGSGSVVPTLKDAGGVARATSSTIALTTTPTDYILSFPSAQTVNVPTGDWATGLTIELAVTSA